MNVLRTALRSFLSTCDEKYDTKRKKTKEKNLDYHIYKP